MSSREMSNNDIKKEEAATPKSSYSKSQWYQLRELARSIKPAEESAGELRNQIEKRVEVRRKKFQIEAEIQSKDVHMEILVETIEILKQRLKELNCRKDELIKKINIADGKLTHLKHDINHLEKEIFETKSEFISSVTRFTKIKEELYLRRRLMINELLNIFKFNIGVKFSLLNHNVMPIKPCSCGILDFIHEYQHLPTIKCLVNHPEQDIISAINALVHLLISLGEILGYVYRFELSHHGLYSTVYNTFTNETIKLTDVFSKGNRDKFITGYSLINKNIAQLRCDVGLSTKNERTLLNVHELLCYLGSNIKKESGAKERCAINDPFNLVATTKFNFDL
uniref:UV radiation resistance-associated protein n=1 Tax=Parastrongyloides trichosuri TaxID=131310 RepID=A0A0N4Z5X1_PARTI